jgi:hypothetical protein
MVLVHSEHFARFEEHIDLVLILYGACDLVHRALLILSHYSTRLSVNQAQSLIQVSLCDLGYLHHHLVKEFGNGEPSKGHYLVFDAILRLMQMRKDTAAFAGLVKVIKELVEGEATSGDACGGLVGH